MAAQELTPEQEAKQAEEQAAKRREAVKKLREDKSLPEASGRYNRKYFWMRWKKIEGFDEEDPAEKVADGYSSTAPKSPNIDYGIYEKEGENGKVRVRYDFDAKRNVDTINASLTDRTITRDHTARNPSTERGWNAFAREKAIIAIKFAAETGKNELSPNFPEGCDFISELGNIGPNTLQYHLERMKAAIETASKTGISIDTSGRGFQAFMAALEKYSRNEANAMKESLQHINASGKMAAKLKECFNPEDIDGHQKALANAGKFGQSDRDAFSKEVDDAVKAQIDKVDALQKKFDATIDSGLQAEIQTKLDIETARRADLLARQADIKAEANDPTKVVDKEALERHRAAFRESINPEQKFIDAVKELKNALAEVKDRSGYTDPQKAKLDEFQMKLDELEKKLAKAPLSDADRDALHGELKKVVEGMNDLAKAKPDFQQKAGSLIEKAEKYIAGKKGEMDEASRIDGQLAILEKAAAAWNKMQDKQAEFNPQDYVGLIVGKQIPLPGIRDQWNRLQDVADVQKYVHKHFDNAPYAKKQQDYLASLEAEKVRLQEVLKRAQVSDPAKMQAFNDRLNGVDIKQVPVPGIKPTAP